MDIVFSHEGNRYVIPFGEQFQPSKFGLGLVKQEFPDAEFAPHVSEDLYIEDEVIGAAHFTGYRMKEPSDA